MRKISTVISTTTVIATLGILFVPGVATANGSAKPEESAVIARTDDYVIVDASSPSVETTTQGTFYPTGPLDEDTLVVIAENGVLPYGLTEPEIAKIASQEASELNDLRSFDSLPVSSRAIRSFTAVAGKWFQYSGDNILGATNDTRVWYSFTTSSFTSMIACGQGLGYYRGYNGSQFGTWSSWYGYGCTSTSNGAAAGGSAPWGNILATKKFKVTSVGAYANGSWQ